MTKKQKKMLYRILAAAVLFLAAKLIPLPMLVSAALYFAAYLTVGCDILRKAWKGICNRQVFDENFLMAVATVGAIALALYERSGDYSEAVAVMLFYQIGELFQSYAAGKSRRSITALMDIRPDYANIERDGKLEQVDPDDVAVGTVITVQPGEKVPIDGVVEDGVSTLNTAALTGESLPRDVSAGDEIISGCINMTGVLKVRTTKAFGESTVSKILELMENSSSHKSRSESFISRFAKVYTPAVCYSALALAILPPLALTVSGADTDFSPYDSGSYASSTTYITGQAVVKAATELEKRIRTLACRMLECEEEDLEFDGHVAKNIKNGQTVTIEDIGFKAQCFNDFPLQVTESHTSPVSPPPYMAGAVEIELDKETGHVEILHYAAVVDCGTVVNPNLARVQVEGGLGQGIGMTLFENVQYTEDGKLRNNSFMQYKIPTRRDYGAIDVEFRPSFEPTGPFGVKSIGEIVINTPAPALADAIHNATGGYFRELPITSEKIAMYCEGEE